MIEGLSPPLYGRIVFPTNPILSKSPEGDGTIRTSKNLLYAISVDHFTNDGSSALISTLFPVLMSVLNITAFYIGILVATGYLVTMVFQPLAGRLSETYDSRNLLAFGISFIGISMVLFAFSTAFIPILISMVILRFGTSFFHPVGVSLISSAYKGEQLDRYMGIQSSFGNLGIFMVFSVSAPLYLYFGWKAPFMAFLLVDLSAVLVTLLLINSKPKTDAPTEEEEPEPVKRKYRLGLPVFFLVAMLEVGGTYAIFINYGNILLTGHSFNLVLSDELVSAWLATSFIGAVFTGRLTRRLGRFHLLLLAFLISGVSTLAFAFFSNTVLVAAATLAINGFFNAMIYPALYTELATFARSNGQGYGVSFGILFSGQITGSALFGFLGGYIGTFAGFTMLFVIAAAILFSGIPLTMQWHHGTGGITARPG